MFKGLRRNNSVNSRKRTLSSLPTLPEGRSSLASSDYAHQCHKIMELYWAIRDLHVETVFDLPRVVVIGGQSSGKSSLVEAVSGITVPRDSGTCTRCPMDCAMSSEANTWSCTIKLWRAFDRDGNNLAIPTTESFGPVIEDKSQVEIWIRRAQAAILSPHRPSSDFSSMTANELRNNSDTEILPFSKNVVQIRVKDPNATDLTFVDLPDPSLFIFHDMKHRSISGLIQNAEENSIMLIRNLVESYIVMPNTLIVVAMPMTDDIENMQALAIAKDPRIDPHKERTIGVLTKPDTLGKGSRGRRDAWKTLLEDKETEQRAKHGYYCVRLLDDDERSRGVGRFESERIASEFFDNTEPWCSIADRGRFGISNFVRDISKLLIELIKKNLPGLQSAVDSELGRCIHALEKLPPVSSDDSATEIMLCVYEFCKAVTSNQEHEEHQLEFIQRNRYRYSAFKHEIEMTTPNFQPFEQVHTGLSSYSNVESQCEARALPDIREIIKKSISWELPGHIPYNATKTLVLQYTSLWKEPSLRCFQDITKNTREFLDVLLREHFGRYKELERYMRGLIFSEHETHIKKTHRVLERLLELESTPLYTLNLTSYALEKNTWLSKYKNMYQPTNRVLVPSHSYFEVGTRQLLPIIYPFPPSAPTSRPAASTWDDEINVMADVQAYFQVAHKRIIDYIPLTIEHELNQAFATSINRTLLRAFEKGVQSGEVDIHDLVREDPVIERKRKELEDRKSRLTQIKEKLDSFCLGGN
ncbi:hypothetical protein CVT25_002730 [Psilocybe cyanescens]|uniref:GED domain-containing protein n=1 Tax=Psilocybe cyanescens TaxID=93625 RepID=A0A409X4L2_PSICY|nr:hypothetical protein CVT25_002730 [Psilocybe cyanescens]